MSEKKWLLDGWGSIEPPSRFCILDNLEVVCLQGLSLVVLTALRCLFHHLVNPDIDGVVGIRSDHHLVGLCEVLHGLLHKIGKLWFCHFVCFP